MNKIIEDKEIQNLKLGEQKIILAGGCFDVLHPGHIEFLEKAKKLGDHLLILLESDLNVKRLKGKNRPINNISKRAKNLIKTGHVDLVIMLSSKVNNDYYQKIVNSICPDIIAITRGDPITDIKAKLAKNVGGKLEIVMDRNPKHSTSLQIMNKLT